jgi:hypothetical protein
LEVTQTLKRKNQKALFEALLKVKEGTVPVFTFSSEKRGGFQQRSNC